MPRYSNRDTTDGCRKIPAAFLKKEGYFSPGGRPFGGTLNWSRNGEPRGSISVSSIINEHEKSVRVWYTITRRTTGEKKEIDYKVRLATTPCRFGGVRHWFICPLYKSGRYCGRRVGVLYDSGGDYFGCRHCYDLSYDSRNRSKKFRHWDALFLLDVDDKIVELEKKYQGKYLFYDGRPTRRQKKLDKLDKRLEKSATLIKLQKML